MDVNLAKSMSSAPGQDGAVASGQKIAPCLWFDDQAEDAARFYTSIFKNSKIMDVSRYDEAGPRPAGMAMVVTFQLEGQDFMALNGGPEFKFTEAVSFVINCKDQAEVDYLWEQLTAGGGEPGSCGWLKDRFGLSWQVVPTALNEMMTDPDPRKVERATRAMLQMNKLDIAALRRACENLE